MNTAHNGDTDNSTTLHLTPWDETNLFIVAQLALRDSHHSYRGPGKYLFAATL